MELEKEIKQKKFSNEYQKALLNIIYTNSWVSTMQSCFFKPYKISPQQYNVLRILKGQYPSPASINLIIDRMLDKMSNASRLVEKLRQKGLVERQECMHDRRQVEVTITPKGMELLGEIAAKSHEIESQFQTLNEEEVSQLNQLLDKLRG